MAKTILSDIDIDDIISKYQNGAGLKQLRSEYKINERRLRNILINNDITIRGRGEQVNKDNYKTNKKYNFIVDYFKNIDSREKAYWLGFLYADGNVFIRKPNEEHTKGGTVEFSLKKDDEYVLYNFRADIKGNMPIKYRDIKLNDKIFPACRMNIGSIEMCNDLINQGCVPNKSLVLEFPKNISFELYSHFIRGYIDGDGSVIFKIYGKYPTFFVTLLGTYNFLNECKNIFKLNGIESHDIKPEMSNAYRLGIYNKDNLTKLYNYLYKDANRFLDRKIDLFRNGLLYLNRDFEISPVAKFFLDLYED